MPERGFANLKALIVEDNAHMRSLLRALLNSIGIKDITPTAGIRTTYGSPLFEDNVPAEDAEVVRRLKATGAIVLAKTNTPEFATGANTVNDLFGDAGGELGLHLLQEARGLAAARGSRAAVRR